jgi:hypothetical protein
MRGSFSSVWHRRLMEHLPSRRRLPDASLEEMSRQLIKGLPTADVTKYWVGRGFRCQAVTRAVESLSCSPLLPFAKAVATRLASREWLLRQYASLEHHFESLPSRPGLSRDEFVREFVRLNRPVIIPGAAASWPALVKWTDTYLKDRCGSASVNVMMNRGGASVAQQYAGVALSTTMRFSDYVDLVASGGPTNSYYLVAKNEFFANETTQVLAADVSPLSIAGTDCRGGQVKLWFGPSGTHTPFHYDSKSSLFVQVRGRKRVRLVSPWHSELMNQQTPWYAAAEGKLNTKATDGRPCFPEAVVMLEPGDALFIPVGWWHEVTALDVSLSLTLLSF